VEPEPKQFVMAGAEAKYSASLAVSNEKKKVFGLGVQIFLSDVIRGRLSGHLGPLHLALGTNC